MVRNIPDTTILYIILSYKTIGQNFVIIFVGLCGPVVVGPPLMLEYSYFTLYMAYNFLYISCFTSTINNIFTQLSACMLCKPSMLSYSLQSITELNQFSQFYFPFNGIRGMFFCHALLCWSLLSFYLQSWSSKTGIITLQPVQCSAY